MNISNAFLKIRKMTGKSQKDIAEVSGITNSVISQIETDCRTPNLNTLIKMSDALGVPLPVIFWVSLEAADIPPEKREVFNAIKESYDKILIDLFLSPLPRYNKKDV